MFLHAISSGFPPYSMTQGEVWEEMSRGGATRHLSARACELLEKILLGDSGIERRYFSVPEYPMLAEKNPGELNRLFEEVAPALSVQVLEKALEEASLSAPEIDALFLCTCTGYLCPGVTSHVAEQMGMRPDVYLNDVVGLGCGAAIPTLRAAQGFLAANPGSTVAVVATEISSSAFFVAEDTGVLISLCLFGDGASASIWRDTPGRTGLEASRFQTLHLPDEREKIRFVNDSGFLRNKLHRRVPELAGMAVKELHGKRSFEDAHVLTHTGGRDVIEAIEQACDIPRLAESREILRTCGNTSSSSVLMVLEEHLRREPVSDHLWLTSFGAGFACHSFELSR